tara:strand:- start:738 stop:1022 length:285 start_codon:yes stop_codon:yes gene_type:complete
VKLNRETKYQLLLSVISLLLLIVVIMFAKEAIAAKPSEKAKFYDFSEQLIDGEIKKPTALYLDVRRKVKFERLLKLKKDFKSSLMRTTRMKLFK